MEQGLRQFCRCILHLIPQSFALLHIFQKLSLSFISLKLITNIHCLFLVNYSIKPKRYEKGQGKKGKETDERKEKGGRRRTKAGEERMEKEMGTVDHFTHNVAFLVWNTSEEGWKKG